MTGISVSARPALEQLKNRGKPVWVLFFLRSRQECAALIVLFPQTNLLLVGKGNRPGFRVFVTGIFLVRIAITNAVVPGGFQEWADRIDRFDV